MNSTFEISKTEEINLIFSKDSLKWANYYYNIQNYPKAINLYKKGLKQDAKNEHVYLKRLALSEAGLNNETEAVSYIESLLGLSFETDFINHEGFDDIRNTVAFKRLEKTYTPNHSFWSLLYLLFAVVGMYTAIILNFNKKINLSARLLISAFVFVHSFFIFHITLVSSNYQYEYPHSYLMSTCFSFLYGPLLYFYFKKTVQRYKIRSSDILHLIPTLLLLIYLIPIYVMPASEKMELMLHRLRNGLNPFDSEFLTLLVQLKLVSLVVYGLLIGKIYYSGSKERPIQKSGRRWQQNLYYIHVLYIFAYAAYGILISNTIASGFLYHFQVLSMALMVLYVGYSANIQPIVFNGILHYGNQLFPKYEKSGLTSSLSLELKENLEYLLNVDKIYKENNICLEILANKLNTTRHNTSQIINEHFNLSFHELINTYRIQEAKELLSADYKRNLNIIDIAYEVGYNNKVTFNKAFKNATQLTPSQYQRAALYSA
ncbi:helix-turn-helix domain-containing protein [uncultured Croceitalea sp.]|uniref:AraC family transcriptional regulator n=1 Tax=uncultured Croceitalea sp. TaxID=1798908 RepID=UPI003306022D